MMFCIKDFFSKCDQIRWKLRIWSHLLKNSLIENVTFCAVNVKKKQLKETIFLQKCKKKFSFNILVLQLLGPTR